MHAVLVLSILGSVAASKCDCDSTRELHRYTACHDWCRDARCISEAAPAIGTYCDGVAHASLKDNGQLGLGGGLFSSARPANASFITHWHRHCYSSRINTEYHCIATDGVCFVRLPIYSAKDGFSLW